MSETTEFGRSGVYRRPRCSTDRRTRNVIPSAEKRLSFEVTFRLLTGHAPFPWQQALFLQLVSDQPDAIPSRCCLPTGLGKSSVAAVWLIALAQRPDRIPRRFVHVINRETVVDQVTAEVERYQRALETEPDLQSLRARLSELDMSDSRGRNIVPRLPLVVCTVRGRSANNSEWLTDPSRPAIVVGTTDTIGSCLLFSAYGVSYRNRPVLAGLLGQDSLLVHDEAQLSPAFQRMLEEIRDEQQREATPFGEHRKLKVMSLAPLSRGPDLPLEKPGSAFELTLQEATPQYFLGAPKDPLQIVWQRLSARKGIAFHPHLRGKQSVADHIGRLARAYADYRSEMAILVSVCSPDELADVTKALTGQNVRLLTRAVRGFEIDEFADPRRKTGCPILARFLKPPLPSVPESERWRVTPASGTVFLVCTPAGQVGLDISADHLVCSLAPFDQMIQRFGRVNRYGTGNARIDVVYEFDAAGNSKDNPAKAAQQKTLELLTQLPQINERRSASPLALLQLQKCAEFKELLTQAGRPEPRLLPTSDILFDAWALTTVRSDLPGRPPVAPYLSGICAWEASETRLAWREEVGIGPDEMPYQCSPEALLEDFPLLAHELLTDRTDLIRAEIDRIAARHPNHPAWVVRKNGRVEIFRLHELTLQTITGGRKEYVIDSDDSTILLPPDVGGLLIEADGQSRGVLSGSAAFAPEHRHCYDVADRPSSPARQRRRIRTQHTDDAGHDAPSGFRLIRRIDGPALGSDSLEESLSWYWYINPQPADSGHFNHSAAPVSGETHSAQVRDCAERFAEALELSSELQLALELAARLHDLGKRRERWQRSIGNSDSTLWYATSGNGQRCYDLCPDYCHEFGSLVDLQADEVIQAELRKLTPEMQDVVRHLIASHHGLARPHIPVQNIFDPEPKGIDVEQLAAEVPSRFARLQRLFGRWGLAYLESLLYAADSSAPNTPASSAKGPL